jgi:uncharacterized membrane protein
MLEVDEALRKPGVLKPWLIYTGSLEGARTILSTVASSMITVAGVVFSITIVVLSLASSQFGPRLIWNFMHDLGNQLVLGTFVSTFMYCLILLGTIQTVSDDEDYLPYISISVALLMAMASLGVLVYFIHHISSSIHASNVAANVWNDLKRSIDDFFPVSFKDGEHVLKEPDEPPGFPADFNRSATPISSDTSGYLQSIDFDGLMKKASEIDLLIRIEYRPGHFIANGNTLTMLWPSENVDTITKSAIQSCFIIGNQRTLEQDVEFAVHQLVEVAVRALSPGVNDPFTAITCIDWLGAALSEVAGRKMHASYRYDADSKLRVAAVPFSFTGMIDAAFNSIRQYGASSPGILIRLLETITAIATRAYRKSDLEDLARHAAMIHRTAKAQIQEEQDLEDVENRYETAATAILARDSGKDPLATGRKSEVILSK